MRVCLLCVAQSRTTTGSSSNTSIHAKAVQMVMVLVVNGCWGVRHTGAAQGTCVLPALMTIALLLRLRNRLSSSHGETLLSNHGMPSKNHLQ